MTDSEPCDAYASLYAELDTPPTAAEMQRAFQEELFTVQDAVRYAVSCFAAYQIYVGHGTDNYWDEALEIVQAVMHLQPPCDESTLTSRLTLKERDFVIAAKTLGVSHPRIILQHIIPNMTTQIIVAASLSIAGAILDESALSYLGYGVALPKSSWGSMLQEAQTYILDKPLLAVYPGLLILLTVLSFNILGDVLRSALEPKIVK